MERKFSLRRTVDRLFGALVSLFAISAPAHAAAPGKPNPAQEYANGLAQILLKQCAEYGWNKIALYLAVHQVVTLIGVWGLSRWLAKTRGTVLNCVIYYLVSAGVTAALFGAGYLLFKIDMLALIAVPVLLLIVSMFMVPMKVFKMSFLATLLFLILTAVVSTVAEMVTAVVMASGGPPPWKVFESKSPEEQQRLVAEWNQQQMEADLQRRMGVTATPAPATPAPAAVAVAGQPSSPSPDLVRLQQTHQKLQAVRAALQTGDKAAVAEFNKMVAAYNAEKARLSRPPPTQPAPSPSAALAKAFRKVPSPESKPSPAPGKPAQ